MQETHEGHPRQPMEMKMDDDTNTGPVSMVEMPLRFDVESPVVPSALGSPVR